MAGVELRGLWEAGSDASVAVVAIDGRELDYAGLRAAIGRAAAQIGARAARGELISKARAQQRAIRLGVLACWAADAAAVIIDGRLGPDVVTGHAQRARARWMIDAVSLAGDVSVKRVELTGPPRNVSPPAALVLFTSGSSGEPKLVLLGAPGLIANIDAIRSYLPMAQGSTTGVVLPLCYSYALIGQTLTTLRAGGTVSFVGDNAYPIRQLEQLRARGVTGLSSVSAALLRLGRAALELPVDRRPDLGYIASAGGPLHSDVIAAIRAAFPVAQIWNQYGLTEACPRVTAISDREPPFARGSVGRPIRGVAVFATDDTGARLPAGQEGVLAVQTPSRMIEYLDDPIATRAALRGAVLHTGDVGWVDDSGYVYVRGRRDGVVQCAGERVSVDEVAGVIRACSAVDDAGVVAVAHPIEGHRLIALVQAADPQIAAVVRRWVRGRLSRAKHPARVIRVDRVPRRPNGKLDRARLRSMADA